MSRIALSQTYPAVTAKEVYILHIHIGFQILRLRTSAMPEPEAEVQAEDDAEPKPRQPLRSRDVLQQLAPLQRRQALETL